MVKLKMSTAKTFSKRIGKKKDITTVRKIKKSFNRGNLDGINENVILRRKVAPSIMDCDQKEPAGAFVKALPNPINLKQIQTGIKALFEHADKVNSGKVDFLDDETPIFLQIVSIKVPKVPNRMIRLSLKHSLISDSGEICLIVRDVGKPKELEATVEYFENILKENNITAIKTIMPYYQFRTEYASTFEMKRALLGLYDAFLVDARISGYVVHQVGKIFIEKRKVPTPVRLSKKDMKHHIDEALKKSVMKLTSNGDTFTLQVGHTKMSQSHVFENVSAVIDQLNYMYPGGLDNIRSLGLKTDLSINIPVYLTLRNKNSINVPVIKSKRPSNFKKVSGELTTFTNKDITVLPTGEVILQNHNDESAQQFIESIELHTELDEDQFEYDIENDDNNLKNKNNTDSAAEANKTSILKKLSTYESTNKIRKAKVENNNREIDHKVLKDEDQNILDYAEENYLNEYAMTQIAAQKALKRSTGVNKIVKKTDKKKIKENVKLKTSTKIKSETNGTRVKKTNVPKFKTSKKTELQNQKLEKSTKESANTTKKMRKTISVERKNSKQNRKIKNFDNTEATDEIKKSTKKNGKLKTNVHLSTSTEKPLKRKLKSKRKFDQK